MTNEQLDQLSINTIRTLSIDAVQAAKSGHPGTPMALAPLVYTLWNREMRFDPKDPIWPNRDRFVLSNGHASMLLWSVLHLTRTKAVERRLRDGSAQPSVTLDDIRRFRQLDSRAPGTPSTAGCRRRDHHRPARAGRRDERRHGHRREVAGAPLQQAGLPRSSTTTIYAVCGDGCMMEGVASEAASLAGHLGLDNLCWICDNNHITIEGDTSITFTEDVAAALPRLRLERPAGRRRQRHRPDRARAAGVPARPKGRPTFIMLDSHIGYGSPNKQDTPEAHGEPLGDDEIRLTKRAYGWPEDAQFLVPDGVHEHFAAGIGARGAHGQDAVDGALRGLPRPSTPSLATEIDQMQRRELPDRVGHATCPSSRPIRRGWPDARPRARC